MKTNKPKIWFEHGAWWCWFKEPLHHLNACVHGIGKTPSDAFKDWKEQYLGPASWGKPFTE